MKITRETLHRKSYLLYVFLFTLYFTYNLLFMHVEVPTIFKYISYVFLTTGFISWAVSFISCEHTKKELTAHIIMIGYFVYLIAASGFSNFGPLTIALSFSSIKGIKIRDAAKSTFKGILAIISVFILLCTLDIIPSYVENKTDLFGVVFSMNRLGGVHGNVLFSVFFMLLSSLLYGYKKYITKIHLVFLELITIGLFLLVYSRTGILMCTLEILFYMVMTNKKHITINEKIKAMARKLIPYIIPAIAVFCVIVPQYYYGSWVYNAANNAITNRFLSAHVYYQAYGFSLLPHSIKEFMVFDNMYAYIFVLYGAINYILCMTLMFLTVKKLLKERRNEDSMQLIMIALYAVSEKVFFKTIGVFPILFIGEYIQTKLLSKKEKRLDKISTKNR